MFRLRRAILMKTNFESPNFSYGGQSAVLGLGLHELRSRRKHSIAGYEGFNRKAKLFCSRHAMIYCMRPIYEEKELRKKFMTAKLIHAKNHERQQSKDTANMVGPILLVSKILNTWRLGEWERARLLGLGGSDQASIEEFLSGNATTIRRDTKDRIAYLIQIRSTLFSLFRDESVENEWLREPNEMLEGHSPLDQMLEGSMESLLLVRDFCDEAGGL